LLGNVQCKNRKRTCQAAKGECIGRQAGFARFTGAIHVYGGDFFGTERSEWDPETLLEKSYSVEKTLRLFEEANAFYAAR